MWCSPPFFFEAFDVHLFVATGGAKLISSTIHSRPSCRLTLMISFGQTCDHPNRNVAARWKPIDLKTVLVRTGTEGVAPVGAIGLLLRGNGSMISLDTFCCFAAS